MQGFGGINLICGVGLMLINLSHIKCTVGEFWSLDDGLVNNQARPKGEQFFAGYPAAGYRPAISFELSNARPTHREPKIIDDEADQLLNETTATPRIFYQTATKLTTSATTSSHRPSPACAYDDKSIPIDAAHQTHFIVLDVVQLPAKEIYLPRSIVQQRFNDKTNYNSVHLKTNHSKTNRVQHPDLGKEAETRQPKDTYVSPQRDVIIAPTDSTVNMLNWRDWTKLQTDQFDSNNEKGKGEGEETINGNNNDYYNLNNNQDNSNDNNYQDDKDNRGPAVDNSDELRFYTKNYGAPKPFAVNVIDLYNQRSEINGNSNSNSNSN